MATVHVYIRTQVGGDAVTVSEIAALAESLGKAITAAGGIAGTVTVVDDPLDDEVVTTPAVANARAEGRSSPSKKVVR